LEFEIAAPVWIKKHKNQERLMKRKVTSKGKRAAKAFEGAMGQERMIELYEDVFRRGKAALDSVFSEVGQLLVESIMYMEREEIAGPDYQPRDPSIQKGGTQPGSVYIGDRKLRVRHPRLHGPEGEIALGTYQKMKSRGAFSEELLAKSLRGLAGRRYDETIADAAESFGVARSTVSKHIVEATAKKLQEFKERDLSAVVPFAVMLDTIHRGGAAFIVALGIDVGGEKHPLGFWEGATENAEICEELFGDLERRGLKLTRRIIFVVDGGKGIIKALRDRFGKKLLLQRCTIHKSRNIQRHLPKKYRPDAKAWFRRAIDCVQLNDAKRELHALEKWLRRINASAADSLLEALDDLVTLHRLRVPELLRKTLHSTNPIESMFSTVRDCEMNIKRFHGSAMRQRWLGTVLLHCEKGFKKIKGHKDIAAVLRTIDGAEREQEKMAA
jgi:transposase-like protein